MASLSLAVEFKPAFPVTTFLSNRINNCMYYSLAQRTGKLAHTNILKLGKELLLNSLVIFWRIRFKVSRYEVFTNALFSRRSPSFLLWKRKVFVAMGILYITWFEWRQILFHLRSRIYTPSLSSWDKNICNFQCPAYECLRSSGLGTWVLVKLGSGFSCSGTTHLET